MTTASNVEPRGKVSVIVPTRNSAAFLEPCLQSVRAQTYHDLELIVVDNSSTDGTPAIARRYADQVITAGPERSAQRNRGAQLSQGEYLLFVDSDMVLDTNVVEHCVQQLRTTPGCASVIIPEVSIGDGFWASCKALERSCYVGDDSIEAPRFFRRAAFESAGGFDESLVGGDDWDLARRTRGAGGTCRVPTIIHHMEGHLTLTETVQAKYYYGQSMVRYVRKHSARSVQGQLTPVRAAYLRHWKRLLRDPTHLAGFVIMKACEIAAGGLGALVALRRDTSQQPAEGIS